MEWSRWSEVVRGRWSGVDGVECECGVEWRVEWGTRGAVPNTHGTRADAQLGVRAKIKMSDDKWKKQRVTKPAKSTRCDIPWAPMTP